MNERDNKPEGSEPAADIETTAPSGPPIATSGNGGCGKYFAFGAGIALIIVLALLGRLVLRGIFLWITCE